MDTREFEVVLTGLNLEMLFLDLGAVTVTGRDPGIRTIRARLDLSRPRGFADVETIVGRLLRNDLVSRVVVDRIDRWGTREVTTTCVVTLAQHDWTVVIDLPALAAATLQ